MKQYALYLESGPRQRKTMAHILELLGCIAAGATTEAALEAVPQAVRAYLAFLQRHGEAVDPSAPFETRVAEYVMEGVWLGNGDPTPGFGADFQPLTVEDLNLSLRRLAWMQSDLLESIRGLTREQLTAEPQGGGRSIYHILVHVAESQNVYLRYQVGKVDGLNDALQAVKHRSENFASALIYLWHITNTRLGALSLAERERPVNHGQVMWTARRALRRMLEHAWEHSLEISGRLSRAVE